MTIDVTRSGHRPRRDCFRINCYRFCYLFVIVSVAESWTIFWDNMRFQRHSQLQCRKWRVERINSSCKCLQYEYVKVSEFNAELEMKHKDCLRRKTNHKNSFIEKCYRLFFSFYRFFNPQHTWEILGNIMQHSYKSNRTGFLQTSMCFCIFLPTKMTWRTCQVACKTALNPAVNGLGISMTSICAWSWSLTWLPFVEKFMVQRYGTTMYSKLEMLELGLRLVQLRSHLRWLTLTYWLTFISKTRPAEMSSHQPEGNQHEAPIRARPVQ